MFQYESKPVILKHLCKVIYDTPEEAIKSINAALAEGYYVKHQSISMECYPYSVNKLQERIMVTMEKVIQ